MSHRVKKAIDLYHWCCRLSCRRQEHPFSAQNQYWNQTMLSLVIDALKASASLAADFVKWLTDLFGLADDLWQAYGPFIADLFAAFRRRRARAAT